MKKEFDHTVIPHLLSYDPDTGYLTWIVVRRNGVIQPGTIAGTVGSDGYIYAKIDGYRRVAHRIAWYLMTGEWLPSHQEIDHRNGIRIDNRWENLRRADDSQQTMNTSLNSRNTSGHRGVYRQGRKWHARINVYKRTILLGYFDNIEDAVESRRVAEIKYFGKFSRNATDGVKG